MSSLVSSPEALQAAPARRPAAQTVVLILLPWLILQMGGLFSPGLLDDVDSIYLQIAREMLHRHDFVTPTIDGIRFFDKPPLPYWLAAASMRVFGEHDWAARLPLALAMLGLLIATFALGRRFYPAGSPLSAASRSASERAGLYAALAMATSIGPYLYTRFYIPDMLVALWMTVAMLCFLQALDRIRSDRSALWPSLAFGAICALSLLTKGLIGIVFPVAVVLLFLGVTHQLGLLRKLHLLAGTTLFVAIAAPWHILAALRNPAIPMPAGLGLPARAGWAWFYLYNEHVARFLGKRIPHDYGQVPIPLFWFLLFLWLLPWAAFLPVALWSSWRAARQHASSLARSQPALLLLLWAGVILGFFTLSSRQEYYHLPALPALAVLVGGLLASADQRSSFPTQLGEQPLFAAAPSAVQTWALRSSAWILVPLGAALFFVCSFFAFTAPQPRPGVTLDALLNSNPEMYNLSLGHVFDLTTAAMGFFRLPLLTVALGMLFLGPGSHLLRRRGYTYAANLVLAGSMVAVLLAAHAGLTRFYPILGSKELAQSIEANRAPGDRVLIDGELTAGSTLLFYTNAPAFLVNGRVNGPWFGSFWPDAPDVFLDDNGLRRLWAGPRRVFLLTYAPQKRTRELESFGKVHALAASGGKTVLTNRP